MKLHKCMLAGALGVLLGGLAPVAGAAESGTPYVSVGTDFSSGKYGLDRRTDIWDVPFTVGYSGNTWSLSATLPYLHVSGPGDVIPGVGVVRNTNPRGRGRGRGGGTVTPTPPTDLSGTASGIGDAVVQATLHAISNVDAGFALDISGRVKFGTADADKGLGTGQTDYGASIDMSKTLGPAWMAFGGVGYTHLGSSSYIRLSSVWNANAGLSYRFGEGNSAGLQLFYQQRPANTSYTRREASLFFRHRINDAWSVRGYVLGGFADGSPDYGAGLAAQLSL